MGDTGRSWKTRFATARGMLGFRRFKCFYNPIEVEVGD